MKFLDLFAGIGGKHDDPYIHQQLRFANNYIKAQGVK